MARRVQRNSGLIPVLLASALLFGMAVSVAATPLSLPENTEVRRLLFDLIVGPVSHLDVTAPAVYSQRTAPHRVEVRVEPGHDHVSLSFMNESRGEFFAPTRGSWIFRRNRSSGEIERVEIHLLEGEWPRSVATLTPDRRLHDGSSASPVRTRMDVSLAGDLLFRDIEVPIAFERIPLSSFGDIQRSTAAIVPWSLFSRPGDRTTHERVERTAGRIRGAVSRLVDGPTGLDGQNGLDGRNGLDGLDDLSFIAWVIDGFVVPETGAGIDHGPFASRLAAIRRSAMGRSGTADPLLRLEFSRFLADAVNRLDPERRPPGPGGADVTSVPFTSPVPHSGFPMSELSRTLYLLALQRPGHLYIGSLNGNMRPGTGEAGTGEPAAPAAAARPGSPSGGGTTRDHRRLVLLVPYFDSRERFQVVMMEAFEEREPDDFAPFGIDDRIHLVSIPVREWIAPIDAASYGFVE